jgi:hypothetical protein
VSDVTALRFMPITENGSESIEERDALIAVEYGGSDIERPVDVHISPRSEDVVTCSLSTEEAWRLARKLARVASEAEQVG